MNRRTFINAAGAFAGLALAPAWSSFQPRKQIDLSPFCADYSVRYDLDKPFAQGGKIIATDGRALVRTTLADIPQLDGELRLPDISKIEAWGKIDGKWKPWPKRQYLGCSPHSCGDECCYVCNGDGGHGNVRQCPRCNGDGYLPYDDPASVVSGEYEAPCKTCKTRGKLFDVACDFCKGEGYTQDACYQPIGKIFIGPSFDARLRRLGELEFCMAGPDCVHFRGDGFDGLLMSKTCEPGNIRA